MLRQIALPLMIIAPFFALPWRFEPRRDDSFESIQRLLESKAPFADAALDSALSTVDPNLVIDGKPLIFLVGIDPCNADRLERLLSRKANPNAKGPTTNYPVIAALRCGDVPILQILLRHKTNVKVRDGNQTPLSILLSSRSGGPTALDDVLKAGADPNEPAEDLSTHTIAAPLDIALAHSNDSAVSLLLSAGANVKDGDYLFKALSNGDLSFAQTLVAHGAQFRPETLSSLFTNLFDRPHESYGPLATLNQRIAVLQFVLNLNQHQQFNFQMDTGATPLTHALGSPELLRVLLQAGADPNFKERDGLSPVAKIVLTNCSGEWDGLQLLLKKGANPNEQLSVRTVYKSRADLAIFNNDDQASDPSRKVSLLEALLVKQHTLDGPECATLLANAQTKIDKYAARLLQSFDQHLYYQVIEKTRNY